MVGVTSNFEFIKVDFDLADFFETANRAEESYTLGNYEDVLVKGRKLAEATARAIADREFVDDVDRLSFYELLKVIRDKIDSEYIRKVFHFLRGKGNDSAHNINAQDATKENALKALDALFNLLVWYMKTYSLEDLQEDCLQFMEPKAQERYQTAERKFIYIQEVDTSEGDLIRYEGTQKIGEGSVSEDDIEADWRPNSDYLRQEAPKRIKQYMTTAGLKFNLGWVELAYSKVKKTWFHDKEVHQVLLRSGIKRAEKLTGQEWFATDLETAKKAIKAVKEGRSSILEEQPSRTEGQPEPIVLRPEQQAAVKQTAKVFKTKDRMLWNAKMRFGKTLTALELVKQEGFQKVLIMTHRPVVKDSWFEDFGKMRLVEAGYLFGSDAKGESLASLKAGSNPFIYFASIQKLRYGQGQVNLSDFTEVDWDFIIIDEAHEGTQTNLSGLVLDKLIGKKTKVLQLSGTPFNILHDFEEDQVYTWDYTMEQTAKLKWLLTKPDEENPYEKLPKVNMFTFEMKQKNFMEEGKSFNFREFFKTDETGQLVYKQEVRTFLDNITNFDEQTQYPFATERFRNELRHTLWLLPGVREANALEDLLKEHPVFGKDYQIINVVRGASVDNGIASQDDLEKVRHAIGDDPSVTKTITLTVRKLTTGVNVPEWTGVIFLSNTNSPMNYLQAAFRAQTPFSHEKLGMKTNCYVFDFAPDRALTVMAESAQINSGVGKKTTKEQKKAMSQLLNFLPILSHTDNGMVSYDVDKMLVQLKKVYAEKAVRSGFEDDSLYNDNLLTLTADDKITFDNLKGIVGKTNKERTTKIVVNENGLTDEEYEKGQQAQKKKVRDRSLEEKDLLEKIKEAKNQRKALISILRGVSIRIPMMIYGMAVDLSEDITIDSFIKAVDDQSWQEFMPKGFTKGMFRQIIKYYDPEVFIEAGRIIRRRAKSFDELDFIERAEKIAELFASFKNPDKETVLTPWRVVNLQISKSLGGLNFYDEQFETLTDGAVSNLHWGEQAQTASVYHPASTILDINAKTGLYPLHAAMSFYYQRVQENDDQHFEADKAYQEILENNIYALAKTPMAKTITQRTLAGYRNYKTNVVYVDGLTESLKTDVVEGKKKVEEVFENVKFDVVIGNPPYQEEAKGTSTSDDPIYHSFMELSYQLADQVVLITPARFLFNAGKTPKQWNQKMLADEHLQVVYFAQKSSEVFPNTDIKGGVAVTYRNANENFGAIGTFTSHEELNRALRLVENKGKFSPLSTIITNRGAYRYSDVIYSDFPEKMKRVSDRRLASNCFDKLPEFFFDDKPDIGDYVQLLGRENNDRVYKWFQKDYLVTPTNFEKYKVVLPKANGSGSIGEVLSTPVIGSPVIGYTETFIAIGAFETQEEAEHCMKYIKSRFARGMLGILKITQDNTAEKWAKVPLWDFSDISVIDWTKSIDEIDSQLYDYYGFDDELKTFFREKIQEMN